MQAQPLDDRGVSSKNLGLGNDIAVNWALCEYNVAPAHGAFLSLPLNRLAARVPNDSGVSLSPTTKALTVREAADSAAVPVLIVGKDISLTHYRALSLVVRADHLSAARRGVFAHDCAVGCSRLVERKLRLVADEPLAAMFASLVFPPTPAAEDPAHFKHDFTAFVASRLSLPDPAKYGLKPTVSRLVVVNPATGTAIFVGAPLAALRDVYATLYAHRLLTPPPPPPAAPVAPPAPGAAPAAAAPPPPPPPPLASVPVRGDLVEYGKSSALVVGATDAMRAGGLRRFLVGPDLVVLHDGGVSPAFVGTTFTGLDVGAAERNQLVLQGAKSHAVVAKCRATRATPLAAPGVVVFIVDDASLPPSASLSPADAAKHIISGYRGGEQFVGARTTFGADAHWPRSAARLEELLRTRNTPAIVINVAAGDAGAKSVAAIEKTMIDVLTQAHTPKPADSQAYASATAAKIDAYLKRI